jgi:hypothetical protein
MHDADMTGKLLGDQTKFDLPWVTVYADNSIPSFDLSNSRCEMSLRYERLRRYGFPSLRVQEIKAEVVKGVRGNEGQDKIRSVLPQNAVLEA